MTDNAYLEIWEAYGASWSEPDETIRKETLHRQLISGCHYTDPTVDITGIDSLSGYMGKFQQQFPGARFVVTDFEVHHDQSLAHWDMIAGNGNILSKGGSFALYKDGRLAKITGFFWAA